MDGRGCTTAPQRAAWSCACLCAAGLALLLPATAGAAGTGWHKASDEELRTSFARGLPDRPFPPASLYLGRGNAIEVLGNVAALLNPLALLLTADTNFNRLLFNPANMDILVNADGASYIRLSSYIPGATLDRVRIRNSTGQAFGSVTIRNIDLRGTTIVVKRAP